MGRLTGKLVFRGPGFVAALVVFCFWGEAVANGTPSVGVAGPPQIFTGLTGENITSYVRVYNDGNGTGVYRIEIHGNVSSITAVEASSFAIEAGANRRVEIVYLAPTEPGYLEGELVVRLEGEQIVPGVTREISITVQKPTENRPPWVRIVFPKEGEKLSGDVGVAVEGADPDGNEVAFEIYIDGELVSQKASFLWRTGRWSNGQHELKATASDSNLTSEDAMIFTVENMRKRNWTYVAGAAAILATFVLIVAFVARRRRSLQ